MLSIYKLFCLINYPLWWLILRIRSQRGKEHKRRYIEKLGYGYQKRPSGEVIWVHALGLGETLGLTLFLENLSQNFKNKTILFTSSTLNSYLAFKNTNINKNVIHQFAPVDNYKSLGTFLAYWKPCMVLISEIDLWPLRILEVKKIDIPLILFNSRMNEKKKNNRKIIYKTFKKMLNCFDYIYLQDEDSKKYFQYFGVSEKVIRICGPFKAAGAYSYKNKEYEKRLTQVFKNKFVWIAASLHKEEEIEILESYKLAKKHLPHLFLVFVPREPEIISDTIRKCRKYSENVAIRNKENQFPTTSTEILIIATIGELGLWYKTSHIAFIGNSLDFKNVKTGKNPFEAIQENCVVIHGPKMLEPGYDNLKKIGITDVVSNRHEIASALVKYSLPKSRSVKIVKGKRHISRNQKLIYGFIENLKIIYNEKREQKNLLP